MIINEDVKQFEILLPRKDKIIFQIPPLKSLTVDGLADCLRGWVQRIHLLEIQGKDPKKPEVYKKTMEKIKDIAQQTYEIALGIIEKYEKENKLNIIKEKQT